MSAHDLGFEIIQWLTTDDFGLVELARLADEEPSANPLVREAFTSLLVDGHVEIIETGWPPDRGAASPLSTQEARLVIDQDASWIPGKPGDAYYEARLTGTGEQLYRREAERSRSE